MSPWMKQPAAMPGWQPIRHDRVVARSLPQLARLRIASFPPPGARIWDAACPNRVTPGPHRHRRRSSIASWQNMDAHSRASACSSLPPPRICVLPPRNRTTRASPNHAKTCTSSSFPLNASICIVMHASCPWPEDNRCPLPSRSTISQPQRPPRRHSIPIRSGQGRSCECMIDWLPQRDLRLF